VSAGAYRAWTALVVAVAVGTGCQLKRPDTVASRMIEPQFENPPAKSDPAPKTTTIRLMDTQARSHIGRRLLRQLADGELVEDPVWRWSSAPDRYLDAALRLEVTSRPDVRVVDAPGVPTLAVTLVTWQLDSANEPRLLGAVELQITGADHVVQTVVIDGAESVSGAPPGNLAAAAGRLLRRLASESVDRACR